MRYTFSAILAAYPPRVEVPSAHVFTDRPRPPLPDGIDLDAAVTRAKVWIDEQEAVVSGQDSAPHTFQAALTLVRGFNLPVDQAFELLRHWNERYHVPPWDDDVLVHKIESAEMQGELEWNHQYPERFDRFFALLDRIKRPPPAVDDTAEAADDGFNLDDVAPAPDVELLIPALPLARVRRKLRDITHPERRDLMRLVLDGSSFAEANRETALNRVCAILGFVAPGNDTIDLAKQILSASIAVWIAEPAPTPTLSFDQYLENASKKIGRAQRHFRRKRTADNTRAGVFRGSHVELGRALLRDLQGGEDGQTPVVGDLGLIHRYSPATGIWTPVERTTQEVLVQRYDGIHVITKAGLKPLNLRHSDILGSTQCALTRAYQRDYFAAARPGIAFQNGFVTVTAAGAEISAHSPRNRATAGLPFEYARQQSGLFLRFLESSFRDDADCADKIALLQEFVGITLIGCAPQYQKALILFGDGDNGKSVFVFTIWDLFPENARVAVPVQDLSQEYRRAMLAGKRLNAVAELPEADVLDSENFKAVVTGDPVTGRFIRESPFTYTPTAGHLFGANKLPGTRDQTLGFWRRWLIVPFNRIFTHDADKDPDLAKKLKHELPGIATWAIEGAIRVLQRGCYTEPPSSREAIELWRQGADQVAQWKNERTIPSSEQRVRSSIAYADFRLWSDSTGHRNLPNINTWATRLISLGYKKIVDHDANYWPFKLRHAS